MLKRLYKVVIFTNENGVYRKIETIRDLDYYNAQLNALQFRCTGFRCTIVTTKREPIV